MVEFEMLKRYVNLSKGIEHPFGGRKQRETGAFSLVILTKAAEKGGENRADMENASKEEPGNTDCISRPGDLRCRRERRTGIEAGDGLFLLQWGEKCAKLFYPAKGGSPWKRRA